MTNISVNYFVISRLMGRRGCPHVGTSATATLAVESSNGFARDRRSPVSRTGAARVLLRASATASDAAASAEVLL